MVHTAAAFAKISNRLRTLACTSSIGPGATNMLTGAAGATINRLPVLLLPGDIFAHRNVATRSCSNSSPEISQDVSVNDCFKPVSRYWDRINRPEQLLTALTEAMRVLTSPADTGAVTLALPQDVQAEAWDYPDALLRAARLARSARARGRRGCSQSAAELIRAVKPSADHRRRRRALQRGDGCAARSSPSTTGIPVGETQAGKGALPFDHPQAVGAVGVTGTSGGEHPRARSRPRDRVGIAAQRLHDRVEDRVSRIRDVRFININVAEFDAAKHAALPLVADARVTLEELRASA